MDAWVVGLSLGVGVFAFVCSLLSCTLFCCRSPVHGSSQEDKGDAEICPDEVKRLLSRCDSMESIRKMRSQLPSRNHSPALQRAASRQSRFRLDPPPPPAQLQPPHTVVDEEEEDEDEVQILLPPTHTEVAPTPRTSRNGQEERRPRNIFKEYPLCPIKSMSVEETPKLVVVQCTSVPLPERSRREEGQDQHPLPQIIVKPRDGSAKIDGDWEIKRRTWRGLDGVDTVVEMRTCLPPLDLPSPPLSPFSVSPVNGSLDSPVKRPTETVV